MRPSRRLARHEIEAKDIRELFRKLAEQYPGIEPWIDRGIAVAINGTIYRDTWSKELHEGAEIFLLPRLAGGVSSLTANSSDVC